MARAHCSSLHPAIHSINLAHIGVGSEARKMQLKTLAVFGLVGLMASASQASDYPDKPVTLVVAYAPGRMTDILTRRIAATLQSKLGRPLIGENRAGATGQMARACGRGQAPDGCTVLVGATSHVINPALKSLP